MIAKQIEICNNIKKLTVISELRPGWNGNNAPAFSESLIVKVREILKHLMLPPEIFPTALGTIQLEYDNSRRDHIEIEISESETAEIFISQYNGEEFFETIPTALDSFIAFRLDFVNCSCSVCH